MSMGNRASAPPSKGGPTPSTNPQVPNPYGSQFQPQRYSNDYFRYQQSGDAFNQPVMGYGTYGQIFTPPPRRQPQPIMGGKGGMGYRPSPPVPPPGGKGRAVSPGVPGDRPFNNGYFQEPNPPSQPPTIGGKGQPQNQGPFMSYPGGSGYGRQRPERRTRQLSALPENTYSINRQPITMPGQQPVGVTGGVPQEDNVGDIPTSFLDFYNKQNNIDRYPVGATGTYTAANPNVASPFDPNNIVSTEEILRMAREEDARNANNPQTIMERENALLQGQRTALANQELFANPMAYTGDMYGLSNFARTMQFQEGGQVPPDAATNMEMMLSEAGPANPQAEMSGEYDRLIQMTMQAVLGQVEQPDEIIQMFIDEFGVDAFRQLRDAVLKQQVPNAQTEGMVDGNGGGMDDQVMGMIGAQRPVAVSPGEYIIPADVVSGLGDGSSKSGADILDELSQAVRMTRTGTTEQPRPLMETLSQ